MAGKSPGKQKASDERGGPRSTFLRRIRRLRGVAIGLLVLVLLAVAPTAGRAALVADLGTIGPGDSGFTFSFEPFDFVDEYTFRVSEPSNTQAAALSLDIFGSFNISNFNAFLFEGTLGSPGDLLASDTGSVLALFASGLETETDYFFRLTGEATGEFGGAYVAGYEVSAVPLPPALVLFLSALLGLVGLSRFRRRRALQTS